MLDVSANCHVQKHEPVEAGMVIQETSVGDVHKSVTDAQRQELTTPPPPNQPTGASQLPANQQPGASQLPANQSTTLVAIQNPDTFELGVGRQRITKADFFSPTSGLQKSQPDADDPFSGLDPLWSLK